MMSAEKPLKSKPKSGGRFLKYASLFVLVLQTTACVLVLRYSRRFGDKKSGNYISSTAIFISELCKLVTCFVILFLQQGMRFDFERMRQTFWTNCNFHLNSPRHFQRLLPLDFERNISEAERDLQTNRAGRLVHHSEQSAIPGPNKSRCCHLPGEIDVLIH